MSEENKQPEEGVKQIPNDIFSDQIPSATIMPLEEEPKKRDYTDLPSTAGTTPASSGEKSAESGTTAAQPVADGTASNSGATSSESTPAAATTEVKKEETKLTPEEQQTQAKQTVDMILKGYDKLHMLGRYLGKVDTAELMSHHQQGKINLDQQLPLGDKVITEREFFSDYNEGIEENIVVSTEFKTDVRPPLERICIKNGWFLSDEMYVLAAFGEDIATKASLLVGLKKTCNLVLEACIAIEKAKREPKEEKQEERKQESNLEPAETTPADDWREPGT